MCQLVMKPNDILCELMCTDHLTSTFLFLSAVPPGLEHRGSVAAPRERRAAEEPYWAYSGKCEVAPQPARHICTCVLIFDLQTQVR